MQVIDLISVHIMSTGAGDEDSGFLTVGILILIRSCISTVYSQTYSKDHLYITTICL